MSADATAKATQKLNKMVKRIESHVNKNWSIKKKAKVVNDEIKNVASYDYKFKNKDRQSAYGELVDKKCVCEGYTMAYELIMNDLGVKTTYKLNKNETHIWNKVVASDKYVDVCWNDTAETNIYFWTNSHEM